MRSTMDPCAPAQGYSMQGPTLFLTSRSKTRFEVGAALFWLNSSVADRTGDGRVAGGASVGRRILCDAHVPPFSRAPAPEIDASTNNFIGSKENPEPHQRHL